MSAIFHDFDVYETLEGFTVGSRIFTGISAIVFIVMICISFFGSSTMMNAGKHRNMIGKIEKTEFTSVVQAVAPDQMIIVDKEIAERIGEKELGSDPGLGSRVILGDFTLQAVNQKLYWIAPLVHTDFFKWWRFSDEGTPGYIRVSATNQEDYAMVRSVNNKNITIKYQPQAFFGEDLGRHIYVNGYHGQLYSDYTFEVDDNWNPYWTVTLYDSKIGFGGDDAIGILCINPETGHIDQYTVDNAPAWIDRIQPEDFVSDQVDDWGYYVHGWLNPSDRDRLAVAGEHSVVLGKDGRSYFYLGLTSKGKENSTVGFVMVDTRTKKTTWFKQAGATEDAAKASAEGKVQEKGYVGSDGITYNIGGYPTYEFLLKDKAGLMKIIALVNVHDHSIVGIGENRHEAVQDYQAQITNRGNSVSFAVNDIEKVTVKSKVIRFSSEVVKGNTYYYFILEKRPGTIFNVGSNISSEVALTREGDIVKVSFVDGVKNGGVLLIRNFDNMSISIDQDSIQVKLEKEVDAVRDSVILKKSEQASDNKWEKLSAEEKRKILKK